MSPVQQSLPRRSEDFYLIPYQQHLWFVASLLVIVPVINVPRVRKDALQIRTAKAQGSVSLSSRCYPILQMISLPKRLLCLKKKKKLPVSIHIKPLQLLHSCASSLSTPGNHSALSSSLSTKRSFPLSGRAAPHLSPVQASSSITVSAFLCRTGCNVINFMLHNLSVRSRSRGRDLTWSSHARTGPRSEKQLFLPEMAE